MFINEIIADWTAGILLFTGMTSFCQKCNQPGHVSSVGVPSSLNILFSWSSTSLPGKSGRPALASSAKMQPADHMSIDVV